MVLAQLIGFAILHHVLRPEAFADARGEELVALLSKSLAACIGRGWAVAIARPAGRQDSSIGGPLALMRLSRSRTAILLTVAGGHGRR